MSRWEEIRLKADNKRLMDQLSRLQTEVDKLTGRKKIVSGKTRKLGIGPRAKPIEVMRPNKHGDYEIPSYEHYGRIIHKLAYGTPFTPCERYVIVDSHTWVEIDAHDNVIEHAEGVYPYGQLHWEESCDRGGTPFTGGWWKSTP